jgi:hypothetical protein
MITRGHYLGEIIDEFSTISAQVKLRNRLGLTDLTVYAENYFRDVLNAILKLNLQNLNESRSNEPGLDLGDGLTKLAIQVTSTNNSDKVNKTLSKITAQQSKKFHKIVVLIIGKRQSSYTLDTALTKKHNFSEEDIWDLDSLARKAISLEIDDLQNLHRIVRSNSVRLRIDLELPDDEGKYPTSGFDHWEVRIEPKIGSGKKFLDFCSSEFGDDLSEDEKEQVRKAIKKLALDLSNIPRITREFLAMLYERREKGRSKRVGVGLSAHLLLKKVEREYQGEDLDGELAILEHARFAYVNGEDEYEHGPAEIILTISKHESLLGGFTEFIEKKMLNYRSIIGAVDLSAF